MAPEPDLLRHLHNLSSVTCQPHSGVCPPSGFDSFLSNYRKFVISQAPTSKVLTRSELTPRSSWWLRILSPVNTRQGQDPDSHECQLHGMGIFSDGKEGSPAPPAGARGPEHERRPLVLSAGQVWINQRSNGGCSAAVAWLSLPRLLIGEWAWRWRPKCPVSAHKWRNLFRVAWKWALPSRSPC
jgi:hypothetical protein